VSAGSSDYSSYDEPDVIKKRYAAEPCEHISPAALNEKKTKKEVVNYLEQKACPKIETHAKRPKHVSPLPAPVPPVAPANAPPAPSHPGANNAAPVSTAPPADKAVKKIGRPKKPADPAAKPKKAPSAYNLAVAKHRKAGLGFAEAAKAAKAELDQKKAESK